MVAALAGCGGGGKSAAPLMPVTGLPENASLEQGPIPIPAGGKRTVIDADGVRTELTCPANGPDCDVTVGPDGVVQYTGGRPEVVTVSYTTIQLPEGHTLTKGTIPAGETLPPIHQTFDTRTVVTCPAGGDDCEVTTVTGNGAESTGGALTVTTYTTLYLPRDLPSGQTPEGTLPAGESRALGGPVTGAEYGKSYVLVCPFDGEDCVVTLGEFDFESTGGAPYVATRYNEMIRQANDGPDGTSDGTHALGLDRRLGQGVATNGLNIIFEIGATGWPRRFGAIVMGTKSLPLDPTRTVRPTASWTGGRGPTFGVSVSGTGDESFSVDEDSSVPALGEGWNGAVLNKTVPTGRTAYAVVYSNIEKASGGTPDPYYQTFGAWVLFPDDPAAGAAQYDLGVFADARSANALSGANVIALSGTATYRGPATGIYTEAAWSGSGGSRAPDTAKVGSFTATATINANFGATGSFTGVGFRGNVTNFMENGESLGNWTVNLNNTSSRDSGNLNLWVSTGARGSADGHSFTEGHWGVRFYRNSASGHPDSAVGTFSASTASTNNNARRILGAFSAERQ